MTARDRGRSDRGPGRCGPRRPRLRSRLTRRASEANAIEPIFRHGVASGDPTRDGVVIWTRVTATEPEPVPVSWTLATDPDLSNVVASGTANADPDADGTVHVDVEGLEPATAYHYGFEALGQRSPTARTRTLPPADADHLRIAMVSCAKYAAGFFNGYGRIAERDDLDFVLHLGDYIYEVGNKPPATQTVGPDIGRPYVPDHECLTLEDYRARYGHYHRDPDLMALHHAHPVIAIVDDHEFADNVWREGSLEHRDERDGPWADRRAAAFRARWEWLPARRPDPADPERVWRSVSIGDLADLLLIDTRTRRDEPIDGPEQAGASRSQLGREQRAWLLERVRASRAAWRLIGNSSVMGHIWDERLPAETIPGLTKLEMTNEGGTGPDPDQWDGYPAERDAILAAFGDAGDVVVLSGDVHIGLAMELPRDRRDERAVGVEFVTTSLTSQNVDDKMGWEPRTRSPAMERAWVEAVPYVKFADFDDHGYVVVDVTPERVRAEWWFVDAVREPTTGQHLGAVWEVRRGDPRLLPGD